MIDHLFDPAITYALGWTLVHALWQGALFALLLGLILILLRRYSAHARYLVAVGLFAGFFLTTTFTFYQLYQSATTQPTNYASRWTIMPQAELRFEWEPKPAAKMTPPDPVAPAERAASASVSEEPTFWDRLIAYYDTHLPLFVTVWLMGVLVLLLRLLGQLALVQRLGTYGTSQLPEEWRERLRELEMRMGIFRSVRYRQTARIGSPFTYGWLRPVVLLPTKLVKSMEESQIFGILAHELAHIKRNDFLVNLLQQLLATLFFFHPGVWWMSARIEEEREHSCDDLAIQMTRQPVGYAKTLISITEYEMRTSPIALAYQGAHKKGIRYRITRLLNDSIGKASFGEGFTTAFILLFVFALAIGAAGQAPESPQTKHALSYHPDDMDIDPRIDINGEVEIADEEGADFTTELSDTSRAETFALFIEAIDHEDIRLVRYFLELGVDVNETTEYGDAPLMIAVDKENVELVQLLIDSGAELDYVNNEGYTAVALAAEDGLYAVVNTLLSAGADPTAHGGGIGWSALHTAADDGHYEVVKLFLDAGINPNLTDHYGQTALMLAASDNHDKVVDLLMRNGADPNIRDEAGNTAAYYAAEDGSEKSMSVIMNEANLVKAAKNPDVLVAACEEGDTFIVQTLITAGWDVNKPNGRGITPLMAAASDGYREVAAMLLKAGADPNARPDRRKPSPLLYAADDGYQSVLELLLDYGADVDTRSNSRDLNFRDTGNGHEIIYYAGMTALFEAVEESFQSCVTTLLEGGANVNLTIAKARFNYKEGINGNVKAWDLTIDSLREKAEVVYDVTGWTPLMEAVEMNAGSIVQALVDAGADVNAETSNGLTPIKLAQQLGYNSVLKILQENR